uniref:RNase H type-1 domain-containing protein n=1 Tax=Cannabis sativa TaxID=3483 RepID=A0A803PQ79_CANSA
MVDHGSDGSVVGPIGPMVDSSDWGFFFFLALMAVVKRGTGLSELDQPDYSSSLLTSSKVAGSLVWVPPLDDWVKINCDVKVGCDSMCVVAITRDHKESILWVATNLLSFSDPLIGEAAACLLAMETAVF